jgi:hypothetical protein
VEIAERASALLGLERGEERSASLMFIHAFCMGLATVLFETAASALFLVRFAPAAIPLTYLAAAVVSSTTGVGYARLERRVPFWPLMVATLLFLLVSVLSFRAALSFSNAAVIVFFLFVWYRLLSILTDLEYWAVATRLYDLQQSKRLFGLIGSGEVVARMAGAFSVPLLVRGIGTANLLVVSGGALLACAMIVLTVRRHDEQPRRIRHVDQIRSGIGSLLRDRYVRAIIAVAAVGILGKHFVDFSFLQQMQTRYADAGRLAGFFGLFSGITQALNLLTRVLFSGRFLQRFGIRAGLQFLPAAHLLCTLALLFVPFWPSQQWAMLFWIAVVNQGIYKTLKHPIDNPSLKVLYQPLDRTRRLDVQVMNELIASPITIGVAGAVMLLFTRVIHFDPRIFGVVMLVTFAAWIVASRNAYGQYVGALRRVLRSRAVDPDALALNDEATLAAIRSHIGSEHAEEAIYALTLLERAGDPEIASLLLDATAHPSPAVRRFAVERLSLAGRTEAAPRIQELIQTEGEDESAAALIALRNLMPAAALEEAQRLLAPSRGARLYAVLVTLLTAGEEVDRSAARDRVRMLAASNDPADRVLACRIVSEAPDPALSEEVESLTSDSDAGVRRSALDACGKTSGRAVKIALDRIADRHLTTSVAAVLVAAGDDAVAAIRGTLSGLQDVALIQRLLRICGRIGTGAATSLVRQYLRHNDERIREQALASLVAAGYRAEPEEWEAIETMIRADAAEAMEELSLLHALGATAQVALLRSALQIEVERARNRILLQLALISDPEAIADARRKLSSTSRQRRAVAEEFLEEAIPSHLRQVLLPVMHDSQRAAKLDVDAVCRRIVSGTTFTPWTVMCATHTLAKIHSTEENEMTQLTIDKVIVLKSVDIFSQTPDDLLAQVSEELETLEISRGETIFLKGELGDSLYIIVSGSVRVHDGEKTIAVLREHQVFGELAVLDPEPRSASVTAETDVRLFRLDRDDLFELLPEHTEIVRGIFRTLCSKIRAQPANV